MRITLAFCLAILMILSPIALFPVTAAEDHYVKIDRVGFLVDGKPYESSKYTVLSFKNADELKVYYDEGGSSSVDVTYKIDYTVTRPATAITVEGGVTYYTTFWVDELEFNVLIGGNPLSLAAQVPEVVLPKPPANFKEPESKQLSLTKTVTITLPTLEEASAIVGSKELNIGIELVDFEYSLQKVVESTDITSNNVFVPKFSNAQKQISFDSYVFPSPYTEYKQTYWKYYVYVPAEKKAELAKLGVTHGYNLLKASSELITTKVTNGFKEFEVIFEWLDHPERLLDGTTANACIKLVFLDGQGNNAAASLTFNNSFYNLITWLNPSMSTMNGKETNVPFGGNRETVYSISSHTHETVACSSYLEAAAALKFGPPLEVTRFIATAVNTSNYSISPAGDEAAWKIKVEDVPAGGVFDVTFKLDYTILEELLEAGETINDIVFTIEVVDGVSPPGVFKFNGNGAHKIDGTVKVRLPAVFEDKTELSYKIRLKDVSYRLTGPNGENLPVTPFPEANFRIHYQEPGSLNATKQFGWNVILQVQKGADISEAEANNYPVSGFSFKYYIDLKPTGAPASLENSRAALESVLKTNLAYMKRGQSGDNELDREKIKVELSNERGIGNAYIEFWFASPKSFRNNQPHIEFDFYMEPYRSYFEPAPKIFPNYNSGSHYGSGPLGAIYFNGDLVFGQLLAKKTFPLEDEIKAVITFENEETTPSMPITKAGLDFLPVDKGADNKNLLKDGDKLMLKLVRKGRFQAALSLKEFNITAIDAIQELEDDDTTLNIEVILEGKNGSIPLDFKIVRILEKDSWASIKPNDNKTIAIDVRKLSDVMSYDDSRSATLLIDMPNGLNVNDTPEIFIGAIEVMYDGSIVEPELEEDVDTLGSFNWIDVLFDKNILYFKIVPDPKIK